MKKNLIILFLLLLSSTLFSQKIFSEGTITYNIFLSNNTAPEGICVVTVKGTMLKREFSMNNGYSNITIYNAKTGTSTSLSNNGNEKYALQLTEQEVKEQNARFENAKYVLSENTKSISGHTCNAAEVTYTNGEKAAFYYCPTLKPLLDNFNAMFIGLNGVPLEYEVKTANGMAMKLVAQNVEIKGIDSQTFIIPKDYKLVTSAEIKNLK